ncbi:ABC transporter ATP-binding protein [Psychrobacter sp. JB385]|uniref:ABC transporter ATP-binding protein n=1 Tax=Psychrobacter sp. JB385 TaxID=1434841 RepID=UPI00097EB663|nr:ATP-binding cassette domain-containing protein [Psychrobacter sp. JB385]SJN39458.1 ABC transporter, ATP-binding protein [Psychrobacter sp. JB385]
MIDQQTAKKVLVQTNNVAVFTKSGQNLVEPISLTLYEGQNVTILGETGSGKSLLAQAIMGALPEELVAQGDILIENQALDNAQLRQYWGRRMAMLPQEPSRSLNPTMTMLDQVWESLFFVAKKDTNTSKQLAKEKIEHLGLAKSADYYPHELSGGMAQRASFAIATSGGAYIVIADEPTKGLDDANKQAVIALLKNVAENGGTLLTITHDIDVARSLSGGANDRMMVMKKGKLLEQGNGEQVLNHPASNYAKQLIAAAPHNWQSQDRTVIQDSPLLTVQDLSLARGKRVLFKGLSFSLQKAEVLGVIGGSGIGKSSLGDTLCGLLKPASGTITWQEKPNSHQVLKLYQDPPAAFASHASLQTLLNDVIKKHRLDASRVPVLLEQLKLDKQVLERNALNVSGGELQRVAILRALLFNPVLLFADEVTSRLDPITQKETLDLLVAQCKAQNCTLIMVSHDHHIMRHYCHQVIDLESLAV